MTEQAKRWIEAAKILAENPNKKVKCPECEKGFLTIKDEIVQPLNKMDRYLICDICGKWNVITMNILPRNQ
ncbi:MAG: hypothetical protein QM781_13115 [Chitinophagaceae bacterium]